MNHAKGVYTHVKPFHHPPDASKEMPYRVRHGSHAGIIFCLRRP
jgi:hypothetical protein